MGKENQIMYEYLTNEERFADLFNAIQFAGRQVVKAVDLKEASEHYVKKERKGKLKMREAFRDLKKRLENGMSLRILALENQNKVDYTMPWRLMDYDAMEYGKQIRQIQKKNELQEKMTDACQLKSSEWLNHFYKADRLAPVYTICLYHGQEKWDGPRNLSEMIDFGEDEKQRKEWRELFADYPMRLVCVNELTDFSDFQSSLGQLFEAMTLREDKEGLTKLLTRKPECQNLDWDTAEAIAVMTKNEKLLEHLEECGDEDGGYSMCKAWEELRKDFITEGRLEGRTEGRLEGRLEGARDALIGLVKDGLLSLKEAASRAGMTEAEFTKLLR